MVQGYCRLPVAADYDFTGKVWKRDEDGRKEKEPRECKIPATASQGELLRKQAILKKYFSIAVLSASFRKSVGTQLSFRV